jgi:hypothetical protein
VTLDAAMAMSLSMGGIGRSVVEQAERHERLLALTHSFGLTAEQATTLIESDRRLVGRNDPAALLMARLGHLAEHGYLTILLGEVLTEGELIRQTFSYGTILNGRRWMERIYGKRFAELDRDRQRALVKAAIELTLQTGGAEQGWPLERAMAAVMPYLKEA